jgi:hypothetical protein
MGDAGEALIDAQARIAERMEEREEERKRRSALGKQNNPEQMRRVESLRLARIELEQQRAATGHAGRKQQLGQAMDELDRQLAALSAAGN